jgi:hypothetical protein
MLQVNGINVYEQSKVFYILKINIIIMKGVELPINTIVIVLIAIAVLLAIIILFFNVYNPGSKGISLEVAKDNACQMLVSLGCQNPANIVIKDFDADTDKNFDQGSGTGSCVNDAGANDNLLMLCKCYYGVDETSCIKTICNCPE